MSEMDNRQHAAEQNSDASPASPSRRRFMNGVAAAPVAASVLGLPKAMAQQVNDAETVATRDVLGPADPETRRLQAARVRRRALVLARERPLPEHTNNGDETTYPNFIGNYHKGLPHTQDGLVDPSAYAAFRSALNSGNTANFANVPRGCADAAQQRPFVDPQSGLSYTLSGPDAAQGFMPPAPSVGSAETASEMVECYWAALARDIPFTRYDTDPLIATACNELSGLTDFKGPKVNNRVVPQTFMRNGFPGETVGPYMSQLLLRPSPLGTAEIDNHHMTFLSGVNFLTSYDEWLTRQNGCAPPATRPFDPVRRIIRDARGMAANVEVDLLAQSYFQALVLLATTEGVVPQLGMPSGIGGLGAPPDQNHPYRANPDLFNLQEPLGELGGAWILSMLWEVSQRAVAAQWYQKYYVHRRCRPEYYGGLVHNIVANGATHPMHPQVLNSQALGAVFSINGTYLLPQCFPEGSPTHPAYGSGHATVAGACITILKAFFDESTPITNPVVPTEDGLSLVPYTGPGADQLTVGGELNKVCTNVSLARTFGGVHWRSDGIQSNLLGEAVAIGLLQEVSLTYNIPFPNGFNLTKFDGTQITVGGNS